MLTLLEGDNLCHLTKMKDSIYDLIYIDPPFNTGKIQQRADDDLHYSDSYDDYLGFMIPRLKEAHRLLKPNGSFFFTH